MPLLKLGDEIINTDTVAHAKLEKKRVVLVFAGGGAITPTKIFANDQGGDELREWLLKNSTQVFPAGD